MYADALLQFSAAQAVGAAVGISTNAVDLGTARDIGEGASELLARVQVNTTFTGLTALTMEVIASSDAASTTNVVVIGSSGAVPVASLVAGARFAIELNPLIASKGQRYVAIRYTPTGVGTGGAVTADLGAEIQDGQKFYATGIAVI